MFLLCGAEIIYERSNVHYKPFRLSSLLKEDEMLRSIFSWWLQRLRIDKNNVILNYIFYVYTYRHNELWTPLKSFRHHIETMKNKIEKAHKKE